MSENQPRKTRRRKYLVDRQLQFTLTAQLLGALTFVGALYVIGLFVLPWRPDFEMLTGDEIVSLLMRANAMYFVIAILILGLASILLTHRVAGAAFAIERVLKALRRREYDQPVALRRGDHLTLLAQGVEELRKRLVEDAQALADLQHCLDEGDLDGARELVARLRSESPRSLETTTA